MCCEAPLRLCVKTSDNNLLLSFQCQNNPIIVMELCSGGCLFSILEDPENHYGLCEEELLAVIRDVGEFLIT